MCLESHIARELHYVDISQTLPLISKSNFKDHRDSLLKFVTTTHTDTASFIQYKHAEGLRLKIISV